MDVDVSELEDSDSTVAIFKDVVVVISLFLFDLIKDIANGRSAVAAAALLLLDLGCMDLVTKACEDDHEDDIANSDVRADENTLHFIIFF